MDYGTDNLENLPNGICVYRLLPDKYWVSSIRIGPLHYSQCDETKELAISALFKYMKEQRLQFEDRLKHDIERLETLKVFLATEHS